MAKASGLTKAIAGRWRIVEMDNAADPGRFCKYR